MTPEEEVVEKLKERFGDKILEAKIQRARRVFVTVDRSTYKDVVKFLKEEMGVSHLSTITGVDTIKTFEVIPLFTYKGVVIALKCVVPKEAPYIDTIIDVIPGAFFYEKEVHEMFGIDIKGHPDLSHLELPDDWPEGLYPLRKDVDLQELIKKITRERD
ncbi:MAG: NADH-quinone oxidoreductase subunit C [Candidatus Nezhaarchaeota archaeon]|nr:NADH-quinone oxidoreductase subunit C [Candidatus Nezhaarchaeota archaeon]MCX8142225.1 NADH-quinone oxidoreductase subunit C [Candidatus Nezhaarchaeota archaeon]MDW8050802.1 NADH-quinone oxidoreductase subunit C [Nitrososphaerota archaeon]